MAEDRFIQVLLPLRLEWDPFYRLPEGLHLQVGQRVRVVFAGRRYTGVVSAVDVTPPENLRVLPVEDGPDLPPISAEEMAFWRALAAYYLCSVGEVFKAACPAAQNKVPKRPRPLATADVTPQPAPQLTDAQQKALAGIQSGFAKGKTVLLQGASGSGKTELYLQCAQECLEQGRSVLYLVPEIGLSQQLEQRIAARFPQVLLYHSDVTEARRRKVAEAIRKDSPYVVLGTRSAVLLPHRNLGLVIVDQEQDTSYKQDAPAPRYHARESAILLAGIQGAHVLLGSAAPSLESLYNAQTGRFVKIDLPERYSHDSAAQVDLIDTSAEIRKKGLMGSFSKKLIAHLRDALDTGESVLLLAPRSALAGLQEEVQALFPEAGIGTDIQLGSAVSASSLRCPHPLALVAVLGADSLLSRQDFRTDEKAFQLLEQFRGRCKRLVIQTHEPGHPVFRRLLSGADDTPRLLEERRAFGFPPFTRLVHVTVKDFSEPRCRYHAEALLRVLQARPELSACTAGPFALDPVDERFVRQIRLMLPRDKQLLQRKTLMAQLVGDYEKKERYDGHITLDVDPL